MTLQLLKFSSAWVGQDCVLCGARSGEHIVCGECEMRLPNCAPGQVAQLCAGAAFDEARAVFAYRFPVDQLIHRFKFAGDLAVGCWLARKLAANAGPLPSATLIVAPPLTPARLRERGFNQALELAKVVARASGARLDIDRVAKVRDTAAQASLGPRERRRNLRGAFACHGSLAGESVVIVDDVLTTGATANALASTLKEAGAGHVSVWAVCCAPCSTSSSTSPRSRPMPGT